MSWTHATIRVAYMTEHEQPETYDLADDLVRRIEAIVNDPKYQTIMAMMA